METKVSDSSGSGKIHLTRTLLRMAEEQKRRRGAVEMGPTALAVAANVRRIRDDVRGWSTYELAGRLTKVGRPIAPSAVSKIERGERQVTVDELAALAIVLGVSPSALMLPFTDGPDSPVAVTGAGDVPALAAWEWADGRTPLKFDPSRHPEDQWMEYTLYGRPAWLRPLRPGGEQYSAEQMKAYREEGKVQGSFNWDEKGEPVWKYPPARSTDG
ncbi:helix-turn-helix domain-containing protein [Streptomyces sp. NPDC001604]|uniref:helix-turn-helix domain-containing protein n=1 Tax=Streptomyces sp. NPDC001604 TaxID=3364593 RepID=UPI0036A16018